MANQVPFSPIDDADTVWPKLVSVEFFTDVAQNINYLIASLPVGTIMPILYGIPGVPLPDPVIWQLCDGSEITDSKSILRGFDTPDYSQMGGIYMKGAANFGVVGQFNGANTVNFVHNHGALGVIIPTPQEGDGPVNDEFGTLAHSHHLYDDLGVVNMEPVQFTILHFIKIN